MKGRVTLKKSLFIQTTALYIGSVVGAGFASGQEIMHFFTSHGWPGIWGTGVAAIAFAYLGSIILYLSVKHQTSGYHDLLPLILGRPAAKIMDVLNLIMMAGTLGVLFAGSGAIFSEQMGLYPKAGIALAFLITVFTILGGLNRVFAVNTLLVPVKIVLILFISLLVLIRHGDECTTVNYAANYSSGWFASSLLYVSYNIPIAALSTLGRSINTRIGILGGIAGGLLLGLLAGLISLAELNFCPEIESCQIPLLFIANRLDLNFQPVIGALIWIGILTTAIANVHGFACRFAPQGSTNYKLAGVIICMAVLPLTKYNFSDLVKTFYPICGYIGLVFFFSLILYPILKLKKRN